MSKIIKNNSLNSLVESLAFVDFNQKPSEDFNLEKLKLEAEELIKTANMKAEQILKEAEEKAKNLLAEAEKEVENIKIKGYQEGFVSGEEKAKEEIEKKYKEIFEEELLRLRRLAEVFKSSYQETIKNAEISLVRLSLEIAKKIVKKEISLSRDVVLNIVKEALSKVIDKSKIVIRVNPEDLNIIKENREKLLSTFATVEDLQIQPDPSIEVGGCILETNTGNVEARIDKQFNQIEKNLTGKDLENNVCNEY